MLDATLHPICNETLPLALRLKTAALALKGTKPKDSHLRKVLRATVHGIGARCCMGKTLCRELGAGTCNLEWLLLPNLTLMCVANMSLSCVYVAVAVAVAFCASVSVSVSVLMLWEQGSVGAGRSNAKVRQY